MVMAMVCAMNAGMIGVSHALNGPANSTRPSTAVHDSANPKLRDMCGLAMSMPKVVQLRMAKACVLRPRNRKPAPPKPISRARDTESEGNTHIVSMMYDMPMAMAVTRLGSSRNEQAARTMVATTARCPPLTAIRCSMPERWKASSSRLAYVESMPVPVLPLPLSGGM